MGPHFWRQTTPTQGEVFMKGVFIAFLFWWDVRRWWCTSYSDSASVVLTVRTLNPSTETIPATLPMIIAMYGWISMSAQVPTATPPARVAFWMCTCVGHRNRGKCAEQAESRRTEEVQDSWTPGHILHLKGLLILFKKGVLCNYRKPFFPAVEICDISCQGSLVVFEWSGCEATEGGMRGSRSCGGRKAGRV